MKKIISDFFVIQFLVLMASSAIAQTKTAVPYGLLCDLVAGQGSEICSERPAFSWILPSGKNVVQTAYQIIVSPKNIKGESAAEIIWNSGKVNQGQSSAVVYAGPALKAGQSYSWKLRTWTNRGLSGYSEIQPFKMAEQLSAYHTAAYPLQKTPQHPLKLIHSDQHIFADFGKDAFAQLSLELKAKKDGDSVVVHLGEKLDKMGRVNRRPGGTIRYARYVIRLSAGTHNYSIELRQDKRNTGPSAIKMPVSVGEVFPFRYVEIEGYDAKLEPKQVLRHMVHYPFDTNAATFLSSDSVLNQVWELCKYSMLATSFTGIYVDGDRERIPYEADAVINQLSHYAVDREFTMARHSQEYLIKNAQWPTEWIMQSVIMAYNDYLYTGDVRSVRKFYNDLKAKTLMSLQDETGLITTTKQTDSIRKSVHYAGNELKDIVDWPQSGILGLGKEAMGETDGFVFTKYNAVTNAYFYNGLVLMGHLAEAVGEQKEAKSFRERAAALKKVYQEKFWNASTGNYRDGVGTDHSALHSNFFALAFGLVAEKDIPAVVEFVRSRGMACSVYGSQFLLDGLYNGGAGAYALSLLTSTTKRSWYNMIREGSTITMEAWDDSFKPNQDWNHAWGAAPGNVISRKLMGIEPLLPAWSSFKVRPQVAGLSSAKITVPTIKGTVAMSFEQMPGKSFSMELTVPANTRAEVYVPLADAKSDKVLMDGKPAKGKTVGAFFVVQNVGSGVHTFFSNKGY